MSEVILQHEIKYPDNEGITLADIAATLVAHERLLPLVGEIFEHVFPGTSIESISIRLEKAETGSLTEAFFVAIFVAYQKQLDENIPEVIEQLTGLQISENLKPIVTVLFIILLYAGTKALFERGRRSKEDRTNAPAAITGNYNAYVNIAAQTLHVTPESIHDAVQQVVTPKRRNTVARAAIDLVRPAKRGGNGRILPNGAPEISASTVAEIPSDIALADLDEDTEIERYEDVRLEVRATDRDKQDTGWAGKLFIGPASTKRLRMKLYPTIDREALAAARVVRAEVLLEAKTGADGEVKPVCIHVLRIHEQPDD